MWIAPAGAVDQRNRPKKGKPENNGRNYDLANYALDWVSLAAGYALQKSANWTKPVFNSEWHGASTAGWRDEHMSADYIAAAVWTGLYHGEAMNVAWYFPRQGAHTTSSVFDDGFAGSFATHSRTRTVLYFSFWGLLVVVMHKHVTTAVTRGRLMSRLRATVSKHV